MRKESDGRDAVPLRSDAPAAPYAVGNTVIYHRDPNVIGTVVHASDVISPLIAVAWDDAGKDAEPVIYPMNTTLLRKAHPWEIDGAAAPPKLERKMPWET